MIRDIQFRDREKFLKAGELLLQRGGRFHIFRGRVLSVNDEQFEALVEAGLARRNGKESRSGGKAKAPKP